MVPRTRLPEMFKAVSTLLLEINPLKSKHGPRLLKVMLPCSTTSSVKLFDEKAIQHLVNVYMIFYKKI
jgi:hypothetical protein